MNLIMLELAKLDFNIVQAMYQDELKELSRWYTETRLSEKLSFARDRLVECFLWNVGSIFEPRFKYCRMMSAKFAVLFTLIDDIYDVHGTLDELEMFTDVIERFAHNS
ncbi:(+)-epi-alpha-bisabolol synthase [Phtheirospermum japonicum]|uniref:(+)-epi-alpha-bisabolol synthase n=1 Tax=Phtheirospermum japonicum TaxID=374723 RepID=A0A830CD50_9LAMI|nr:(+)-epi-alpha-bisabolol synthase [Phtheirospermum japonicum]